MERIKRLLPQFTIRLRVGLALGVAVLPFMIVLLLAYFWVYQPLQHELRVMSRDVEVRFDSVARLQVALTRSTMPVNDYLIHGHVQERREYQVASARVEAAFIAVSSALSERHDAERATVSTLYERWKKAARQGEAILNLNDTERRTPFAAMAMESNDADIDKLVNEADLLLDHVRRDLQHSREQLEINRERMTWFLTLSIMIAAVVTLVTVVYLGQLIPSHLDRHREGALDRASDFGPLGDDQKK